MRAANALRIRVTIRRASDQEKTRRGLSVASLGTRAGCAVCPLVKRPPIRAVPYGCGIHKRRHSATLIVLRPNATCRLNGLRRHESYAGRTYFPARLTGLSFRRGNKLIASNRDEEKNGEDGIRTRGRVLPRHRFSKPALSATQPPLQNLKYQGVVSSFSGQTYSLQHPLPHLHAKCSEG